MGVINLQDVQAGMVLAQDLKDRSGRIILSASNSIEENHIRIFRMWGITEVDVAGVDKEEIFSHTISELDPALVSKIEENLKEYFLHSNIEHPFTHELFHLLMVKLSLRKRKE